MGEISEVSEIVEEPSPCIKDQPAAALKEEAIVAVAVGSSNNSIYPFKWALNNLATSPGSSLLLIHVYPPLQHIPSALGIISVNQVCSEVVAKFKKQQQHDLDLIMKKYESFCEARMVIPIVSLVENESINKGLVDYVTQLGITKLVIGHTSRSKLTSAFSGPTRSKYVMKHVSSFCDVMTVRKDTPGTKQFE